MLGFSVWPRISCDIANSDKTGARRAKYSLDFLQTVVEISVEIHIPGIRPSWEYSCTWSTQGTCCAVVPSAMM